VIVDQNEQGWLPCGVRRLLWLPTQPAFLPAAPDKQTGPQGLWPSGLRRGKAKLGSQKP
jgi:hypothetical protein